MVEKDWEELKLEELTINPKGAGYVCVLVLRVVYVCLRACASILCFPWALPLTGLHINTACFRQQEEQKQEQEKGQEGEETQEETEAQEGEDPPASVPDPETLAAEKHLPSPLLYALASPNERGQGAQCSCIACVSVC